MISTKGRYALRVMLHLAAQQGGGYLPLKEIAAREAMSTGYVARIMAELSRAGLVEGVQGKGGGYRLPLPPQSYTVGEILRACDENFAPVACVAERAAPCARAADCRTLPLWQGAYRLLNDYFDGVTLADLIERKLLM